MNENELSLRLSRIFAQIPEGAILADIGSDHAYLPTNSYKSGKIVKGIAGEVNEGPYQSAYKQVEKVGLKGVIDVRFGSGLSVINKGEVDCIVIAGMGGPLISEILEQGKNKLSGNETLILQPNNAARFVRTWLNENEWLLIHEEIIEEDSHIYEILVAKRGNPKPLYEENEEQKLLLGPFLILEKNQVFVKKWENKLDKWKKILKSLEKAANNADTFDKKMEITKKIHMVEEVLKR